MRLCCGSHPFRFCFALHIRLFYRVLLVRVSIRTERLIDCNMSFDTSILAQAVDVLPGRSSLYSSYLSHMTRPSRDDDHDCVRIESQALSELGHVVKVNWKAWRYNTKEVFLEVRSVLDDFFEKDETSWETARILKKQMGM